MWQAIGGHAVTLTVANHGAVDHRVETTEVVDARCYFLCAGDGAEVVLHERFGVRQGTTGVFGTSGVTGVKDDLVALAGEQLARHQPSGQGAPRGASSARVYRTRDITFPHAA
jgi:hypothetical protein